MHRTFGLTIFSVSELSDLRMLGRNNADFARPVRIGAVEGDRRRGRPRISFLAFLRGRLRKIEEAVLHGAPRMCVHREQGNRLLDRLRRRIQLTRRRG